MVLVAVCHLFREAFGELVTLYVARSLLRFPCDTVIQFFYLPVFLLHGKLF